jgi:hypothetical protein
MLNRGSFQRLLSAHLYPLLREEGFRGSGGTLRRIKNPVVHIFHFQGSRNGDGCFLNLGAHLTFLPPEGGLEIPPERFDDAHCAFRTRINRPGTNEPWPYGERDNDALAVIQQMASEWRLQAAPFFNAHGSFPESFSAQVSAHHPTGDRSTLHYARIAAYLGLTEKAIALANAGLERTSPRASGLRFDLAAIVKESGGTLGAA